ncbi:MAG TPA: glycosyltransferase [Candidatus Angelobacter sp.]|jgi:sterol 3beta-glucosyltransferase
MRVVLTNFGTLGDFRPLLILANELAANGCKPVLAFPPFAQTLASEYRFEHVSIGPDLLSLRDSVNASWSHMAGIYESSDQMAALLMPFRDAFDQTFSDLTDVCRDADLLISGPGQPLARIVHELTGIPFVSIQVSHFGGSGGPALRDAGDQLINPFRRKLGLPAINDPLTAGTNSPQLAIYAMSKHLRPRPADWPAHYRQTGFFFDRHALLSGIDPMLVRFVEEGEPPVVVTLGSMVHRECEALAKLLADAMYAAGVRAVIQGFTEPSNWSGKSDAVYWAGFVPHEWIFPRAACIILHGGAGTAAYTFDSGVPGIFVPHGDCYDQRYWGQLAWEIGCAVPPIPYGELSLELLTDAITATMNNEQLRSAAGALGEKVRKEPGVRLAAKLVHEYAIQVGVCQDVC